MKKKLLNNKGLSLLEYVVVFAIIMIVGAVMTFSLSALLNKPADQCAAQLKVAIDRHRQASMGKESSDLFLYVDGNGVFITETYDSKVKTTQIGAKGVTVKYEVPGSGYSTVNATGVHIQFDRTTGAMKPDSVGGSTYYRKKYEISKGDVTKTLTIVPLTGKVTVE